jgi:hypothetical protein
MEGMLMKKIFQYLAISLLIFGIATNASAMEFTRDKGVATKIAFPLIDTATNLTFKTGASGFLIQYSAWNESNGGPSAFGNIANQTLLEIGTSGVYYANLSAAEMNNDHIVLLANATTTQVQGIVIDTVSKELLDTISATATAINVTETAQNTTWTAAKAAYLDFTLSTLNTNLTLLTTIETAQNNTWTAAKAAYLDLGISTVNTTAAAIKAKTDSLTFTVANMIDANVIDWKGAAAAAMTGDAYSKVSGLTFTTANKVDARAFTVDDKTGYSLTGNQTINISGNLSGSVGSLVTAPGDSSGVTTLLSRLTDTRAGYLDYLNNIYLKLPTNYIMGSAVLTDKDDDIDAILVDTAAMDTSTELRTLLTGSDTAVSTLTTSSAIGSLTGAVGSVTGNVTLGTADKTNIANLTWDVVLASHVGAGSTGYALNAAGAAGDPWSTSLPGAYGAGSAGYIVGHNIDALISSRMATFSYTAPDNVNISAMLTQLGLVNSTVTSFNTTWTPTKANYLDAAITGRMATFTYTAPDNANISVIATQLGLVNNTVTSLNTTWTPTKAGYLDVAVSSRMATFTYLAPDNANTTLIYNIVNNATYGNSALKNAISGLNNISAADFWGYAGARTLTAGTNIVLAKGVGITGFNDIAVTDVWAAANRTLSAFGFSVPASIGSSDLLNITGAIFNATMTDYNGTGTIGNKINIIPTSGTGDWTASEKVGIKAALSVNATDNNETSLSDIKRQIKIHQ